MYLIWPVIWGMGFIENNKAECMQSVLINTNLLISCKENGVKKYFFPQVPVLIISRSNKRYLLEDLRKQTLILQIQKMDMVGKNYLVNVCVDILWRIME